ncbi:RebB family R body protein [Dyella koreensis]|uniref:RebB family R body protein n=1 Tax=Dyella koreensis TaxID=311235 RepID=A0ABW8K3F8_9GAMM
MSTSTQVNPQVTDAVVQTNPSTPGGAPTISLNQIYMATAQALMNAAHNAVNSQQQSFVLMQAATTQAVMQLLSIDGAGKAAPLDASNASGVTAAQVATASPDASAHIERVSELPNKLGLDNAGPWSHAVREIMNTLASALRELQSAAQETDMAMVKQAAIAAVLTRMIKAPDQREPYQKILELIEGL